MISLIVYLCAFVLFFKQFLTKRLNKISEKRNAKNDDSNNDILLDNNATAQDAAQTDNTTVEENEKIPEEEIIDDVNKEIEEITPPNVEENTNKEDETK